MAGLTNMEHQSKILVEAATLTMMQQKFDRFVSLEMTDQLTPHFNDIMHCTTKANMQRLDHKKSREVRTSLTSQYVKPHRGCEKYSHPNRSMNRKDCLVAKVACFNCEIIEHMERVCQKPKRGSTNKSAASMQKESHILTTRGYIEGPRIRTG